MKNILVPTDFSENSGSAVEYAAVIAQACKSSITLMSVYTPAVSRYNAISSLLGEEVAEASNELKKKLLVTVNTIKELYPDVPCQVFVGVGEIVDEILLAAKNKRSDIIIMGTQGASSIEKVLLGSNAADVIEKAACPVLVIPAGTQCIIPKKILFATDYAYSDIEGAKMLASMAQFFGATITFVHITKEEEDLEDEEKLIEKFTKEIKIATDYPHINSKTSIG